jgi:hypothetical protein
MFVVAYRIYLVNKLVSTYEIESGTNWLLCIKKGVGQTCYIMRGGPAGQL